MLLCPWNSPGKSTGVCCHALLQGVFLTQELNPSLLHCRWILYPLSHLGNPESILLNLCSISFLSWELPCHYDAYKTLLDAWEAESLSLMEEYLWLFNVCQRTRATDKMNEKEEGLCLLFSTTGCVDAEFSYHLFSLSPSFGLAFNIKLTIQDFL